MAKNDDKPDVMLMAAKSGAQMYQSIRNMRKCSSKCPMFDVCPLAPISIKPANFKERHCLVNAGSHDVRRAYINMFLRGHSGLVDEMMRAYTGYLSAVEDYENEFRGKKGEEAVKLTPKDRERLVNLRFKILEATLKVHKTCYGDGYQAKQKPEEEPIKIIETTGDEGEQIEIRQKQTKRPVISKKRKEDLIEAEYKVMEEVKPDPESLIFSERLKEEVLPSMVVMDPDEVPTKPPQPAQGGRKDEPEEEFFS